MIFNDLGKEHIIFKELMNNTEKNSNILLVVEGGMGDFIMFLDVFEYIRKKFDHLYFKIGSNKDYQYQYIIDEIYPLTPKIDKIKDNMTRHQFHTKPIEEKYFLEELKPWKHVIKMKMMTRPLNEHGRLIYPKAVSGFKYYLRLKGDFDFGYNKGYIINKKKVKNVNETDRVSFHVITNTGRRTRTPKFENIKDIYNGIKKCGYKPFLIYNNYKWKNPNEPKYDFSWIPEDEKCKLDSTVDDVYQYIADSKFFFGVVSGPIFLANKVLSGDRCISINLDLDFNNYLDLSGNKNYDAIVGPFNEKIVVQKIKNMEKKNGLV